MQFPVSNPKVPEKSEDSPGCRQAQNVRFTENFHHFVLGIWDLYIQKRTVKWRVPFYPLNGDKATFMGDLPYLWKAIYDLSGPLLFSRLAVSAGLAFFPAASLWLVSTVT
jgi:hypothetical protein